MRRREYEIQEIEEKRNLGIIHEAAQHLERWENKEKKEERNQTAGDRPLLQELSCRGEGPCSVLNVGEGGCFETRDVTMRAWAFV